ncbi:sensor histidine kinase [Streptomyces sp. NPDC001404]|uniref:sensor histidine kinase n=1 Tax=Streptomyces sp. NPDC001404 TaxID=3364571 RepID=UPI0036B2BC86
MVVGWWRAWPPRRVDAVLVAVVVVAGVADSWVTWWSNGLLTGGPRYLVAGLVGVTGLALWWRRRFPVLVAVVLLIAHTLVFTPLALAVALFTVGEVFRDRLRVLWTFGVAGCVADLAAARIGGPAWDWRGAAYSLALVTGSLIVGYAVAVRRDLAHSAQELARAAQGQLEITRRWHELLVEQARAQERREIARELHDVVSHRVGHMVMTATTLTVGSSAGDARVVEKAELIGSEGRAALEELREILGVLAPEHTAGGAPRAPQPGAGQLPELVERARVNGQRVDWELTGDPQALGTVVQHALYRMVQEALTNAHKHAPGSQVRVVVDCRADGLHLEVVNTSATGARVEAVAGSGSGLLGVRERAALLGGYAEAGPYGDGFRLAVFVPGHAGPTRSA